jgi:hypothetical protein
MLVWVERFLGHHATRGALKLLMSRVQDLISGVPRNRRQLILNDDGQNQLCRVRTLKGFG